MYIRKGGKGKRLVGKLEGFKGKMKLSPGKTGGQKLSSNRYEKGGEKGRGNEWLAIVKKDRRFRTWGET